ncbi:MAG: hypothetical protein HYU71_03620 [Bacteroidetes bacterium]|nr:hypothetical protein [Bacteroidota bacterium]
MTRFRKISIILLTLSSSIGVFRGARLINDAWFPDILFPFPEEKITDSLFSNYAILGWILLSLVGVFGFVTLCCMLLRKKIYPYLIIIQGIFISFLSLTHLLYSSFSPIHLFTIPIGVSTIVIGVMQTPREF